MRRVESKSIALFAIIVLTIYLYNSKFMGPKKTIRAFVFVA